MEAEAILDEQIHKKGRHRKKQLYNSIMQQMEFYFSDSNLSKDKFLLPLVQNGPDVDIAIFLNFNKIRKLTTNTDDIVKAINNSQLLELSEDKTKVKRKTALNIRENVDNCTLYIERIKLDATHEWLGSIFSLFGNVTYVSIPRYKHNKANKGFAFVEFETEEEATGALNYFESIGCRMSSTMAPENLCSITTYEGNTVNEKPCDDQEDDEKEVDKVHVQKKRKHSTEEDESSKRIKTDNTTDHENTSENIHDDDYDGKKKKKHKKIKKKIFRELGLQVLSRMEWKKIRNRYLDNQKAKMKQLKKFLYRNRFNNHVETKPNIEQDSMDSSSQNTTTGKEKHVDHLAYVPGVIVKIQLSENCHDLSKVKEEMKQYPEIKYVDLPTDGDSGYLRFSDGDSAKQFCTSGYKGQAVLLEGKEEEEYWIKINNDRSLKYKKNQKRLRGREKLLKKAEKELGKHIKFDDTD